MFFVTATGNLEHCFILETNFPKDENLYKKLEYRFSIQSLKLKTIFLYKTAHSEANVKTNRMGSKKVDLSQGTEFC